MNWFWLIFLGVYASIHAVLFVRLRPLLPAGRGWSLGLAGLFLLLLLAPPAVRALERAGHDFPAMILAWIAFVWMGLAGLGVLTSLASWLVQGLGALASRLDLWTPPAGWARGCAAAALVLAALAAGYGVVEARSLRLERVTIATNKLPPGVDRLVVALVSDVHLGLLNGHRLLSRVVELIRAQNPDLVVSTGDLVDGNLFGEDGLASLWAALNPPLGKYAVLGNHEVYAGLGNSIDFHHRSGFVLLRDQGVAVGPLNLAGVDDPALRQPGPGPGPTHEVKALAGLDPSRFTLLLKHRPNIDPAAMGRVDLQLSGHTHQGQVWPFRYITGAIHPMQAGYYPLDHQPAVYTSRGTGTWGPPMRIAAPPEITIIELVRR